ncbi:lysosomal cystine transporter [Diplocarpon rosae]|nr:lysosomal cystine transporter [Diplocarpon rosae]
MAVSSSFLPIISYLFGWIYTSAWSLSFYPQPILNFRRGSTTGTTVDFPTINVLGFIAYFISNAAFLYSPTIREQYAIRNHGLTPAVQFNDLAFAAHAVVLSAITLSQFAPGIWGFEKRGKARPSKPILSIFFGSLIGVAIVAAIVASRHDTDAKTGWVAIDVVYAISYVKLIITLVKYMPQVLTNYKNKSTHGWSIAQILLDFVGGILSILQLGIDSYLQGDWAGITGNPVKLALGNISMFFDIIFMIQHYIIYPQRAQSVEDGEINPLLGRGREERIE